MIYGEGMNIVSKFQLPSYYGLGWQRLEDWEEKDHSVDASINELKAVCRTARATRGQLISFKSILNSVQGSQKIMIKFYQG